ncbi:Alpha/Beta hydrolase protein, partial [Vararia minispora EC-137]
IAFAILIGVFSRTNKKRSWKRAIHFSQMRHVTKLMAKGGINTAKAIMGGTTGDNYCGWVKSKRIAEVSEGVGEGAYLHWIGEKSLGKVLLFFHGGGYSLPMLPTSFDMLLSFKNDVKSSLGDIGVCVLEYSLTPGSPFPKQLSQANAALMHLLSSGVSASDIVLAGDSAGGNLVLQLLSHILHPLPSIPPPPELSSPLRGAYMISPWVGMDDSWPSFEQNAEHDIIDPSLYRLFAEEIAAGMTPDLLSWVRPVSAQQDWWTGLVGVVPSILVTAGKRECLYDEIDRISTTLKAHVPQLKTFIEENGVHEDLVMAFGAGAGRTAPEYPIAVEWLKTVFA